MWGMTWCCIQPPSPSLSGRPVQLSGALGDAGLEELCRGALQAGQAAMEQRLWNEEGRSEGGDIVHTQCRGAA
jgi:hypothetical protein